MSCSNMFSISVEWLHRPISLIFLTMSAYIHSTTTYILTTHHHLQLTYFPLQSIDLLLQLVILFVQSFLNCLRRTLSARMLPGSSNRWLFDPLVEAMVRQCLLLSIIDD